MQQNLFPNVASFGPGLHLSGLALPHPPPSALCFQDVALMVFESYGLDSSLHHHTMLGTNNHNKNVPEFSVGELIGPQQGASPEKSRTLTFALNLAPSNVHLSTPTVPHRYLCLPFTYLCGLCYRKRPTKEGNSR